ncbi:hypothetical protein L7F22_012944 [Adiantum nelumboides]|nr:hypothetical protein [Adiantum nelumboides]
MCPLALWEGMAPSIRRRALDLLYGMCDVTNAKDIVEELLQYLTTADFGIREELALKAAILAEKFAPDLLWYVDVILQLIDKAGDFISDDIWFRVVQFVTNNDDLQAYAALKARDYLSKLAVHETMVKVGGYLLGEYGHLLARTPGCTPKEIFFIIHDKFPTVSISTKALLLSAYIKLLMHSQPSDPDLQEQVWRVFKRFEGNIDAEVQQRAVEYFALSRKGPAMVDIMAEMPKFPERQSALLKKTEDTEGDAAELSATRLRVQQQSSNAMVVVSQPSANGSMFAGPLTRTTSTPRDTALQNGELALTVTTMGQPPQTPPQPAAPVTSDLLGDLLAPLAIEAPPAASSSSTPLASEPSLGDSSALALLDSAPSVQPTSSLKDWFHALCFKDSGVLYEDPYIQIGLKAEWRSHQGRVTLFLGNKHVGALSTVRAVILPPAHLRMHLSTVPETIPPRAQVQCPLEIINLHASRDFAVLDFSYSYGNVPVNVNLRLPIVLSKFLQGVPLSPADFVSQWRALTGPPLKLQEVVRGVKPLPIIEMTGLFSSIHITVAPGLDPNPNNIVAGTVFASEARKTLCLVRVETDPSDRTQLRLTVASSDAVLSLELKEFIKEHLLDDSSTQQMLAPVSSGLSGPAAALAGLL